MEGDHTCGGGEGGSWGTIIACMCVTRSVALRLRRPRRFTRISGPTHPVSPGSVANHRFMEKKENHNWSIMKPSLSHEISPLHIWGEKRINRLRARRASPSPIFNRCAICLEKATLTLSFYLFQIAIRYQSFCGYSLGFWSDSALLSGTNNNTLAFYP